MAKVSATSSKGGTSAAAVVNSAKVAQSSTAMPPTRVAARREGWVMADSPSRPEWARGSG